MVSTLMLQLYVHVSIAVVTATTPAVVPMRQCIPLGRNGGGGGAGPFGGINRVINDLANAMGPVLSSIVTLLIVVAAAITAGALLTSKGKTWVQNLILLVILIPALLILLIISSSFVTFLQNRC